MRDTIPPRFFSTFAHYAIEDDPSLVKEAIDSTEGELWKRAMKDEMESLRKNETCALVALPNGRKLIDNNWVFKKKLNAIGRVDKYNY